MPAAHRWHVVIPQYSMHGAKDQVFLTLLRSCTCFEHAVRPRHVFQVPLVYEAHHIIKQEHVNRPQGIYIFAIKQENNASHPLIEGRIMCALIYLPLQRVRYST